MSGDVPSPKDNIQPARDTVTAQDKIGEVKDRTGKAADRGRDACGKLRARVMQEVETRLKKVQDSARDLPERCQKLDQYFRKQIDEFERLNYRIGVREINADEYIRQKKALEAKYSVVPQEGKDLDASRSQLLDGIKVFNTLQGNLQGGSGTLQTNEYAWQMLNPINHPQQQEWMQKELDAITRMLEGARPKLMERIRQASCKEVRAMADKLGIKYLEEEGGEGEERQAPPDQAPLRYPLSQISFNVPRDWSALSISERQTVDQVLAGYVITAGSIFLAMTFPSSPPAPRKKSTRAKGAKPARPTPKLLPPSPADQRLREALLQEAAGKLPSLKEIEAARCRNELGDDEYWRLYEARLRVDLSRAEGNMLVLGSAENDVAFSRLLPDGTIYISETKNLGAGHRNRFQWWIYLDGKEITWSSISEDQQVKNDRGVTESVFKEETIVITEKPDTVHVYSSTVTGLQEQDGKGTLPLQDITPLEASAMQARLQELRQDREFGPWDCVGSR